MNSAQHLWSPENIQLGKLLLAVADMQFFVHENWTSASERHSKMPTSTQHYTRSQTRHSSMLAVHARPLPEDRNEDDPDVSILIRRKKLSLAWEMMQSCDPQLWVDVCSLYAMIKAVEQDEKKFQGVENLLEEVAEAKTLMRNAEILGAVETIESYRQEEWYNESSPCRIRRGSMVVVHDEHHDVETVTENKVRHLEHAEAWQKMKSCNKDEWTAACHYHEEYQKHMIVEKLKAAVWVIQDYNESKWSTEVLRRHSLPSSMRHAATLVTLVDDFATDEEYKAHKKRLIEAWQIMKEANPKEWTKACKSHEEDLLSKGLTKEAAAPTGFGHGLMRIEAPARNGISGIAA
mmetsp:Transcript_10310/g.20679  ORF Transcript_10310/g.20679 Transcript_10310/m.20679 type:complete len:348 (+) Transcript_10310:75-1118(+)